MKLVKISLAAIILMELTACGHQEHAEEEHTKFIVTTPIRKDTLVYNPYVCQIHAYQHIEVRAIEQGYLQEIYVDEGQHVKKGQLMFQIMPTLYKADVQKAQAEVSFAEIEYQNTKNLNDSNIVSNNELAMSRAKLSEAQAELAIAQAHLGFTEIRAPFDGIMDRFHVRKGSLVEEGELLTMLSDNSHMWVYYNVPEAEYLDYITETKKTEPVRVKLEMANKKLFEKDGVIETIEADFNSETGNIAFRSGFNNEHGILRHGETGNILMPVPIKDALLIPQKSTFEILDKKFVFVISEEGLVSSRQIDVGIELPHLYAVVDGLKEDEMILVEGLRKVKNNQTIEFNRVDPKIILSDLHALHAE